MPGFARSLAYGRFGFYFHHMSQNEGNSVHARNRAGEPRKRAAIACQSCNSKRIKCNAALMLPCSNCERSGRTCQLIESRRGQRKVKTASDPRYSVSKKVSQHASSQNPWSSDRRRSSSPPTLPRDERFEENIDITKQRAPVDPRSLVESQTVTGKDQQQKNSLETVSLQMIPASSVERGSTTKQTKWPVFVAQSPEPIVSLSPNPGDRSFSDTEARQEVMDLLLMQQVFDIPTSDTCMQFFRVFFYHVAPAYPIIDRASFLFQFAIPHHPPSWLLLQAVLFAATCHCEENLVREAGFESRSKARMTLFKRVKALYDADHEKDKFTVVQATFLMSIHWISPVDLKDNWYWLQVSINLALAINMHRSSKDSWMPPKLQILRKKLWWSLYTEDKLLAAALGRPARIHSNESDLEPLEMSDFDAEPYGFGDTFRVGLPKAIMAYPICLASLAKIAEKMGEHSSQISKPTEYSPELCTGMLQVWEAGLPEFYQLKLYERTDTIWPSMIQIAGWYVIARLTTCLS